MSSITTTINHGITFGTSGYYSPLTITSTGAVNNNGTGKAVFGGNETVVNDGRITATGNSGGYGYQGVYLGGGYVNNHGTITAYGNAVVLQGAGTVVNSGVIFGHRWGVTSRGLLSVTNTGTISGESQGTVLSGGGLITNSDLIAGYDGVGIGGAAGTVVNSGSIVGTYGAAVNLSGGGTIINTGTGLISNGGFYAGITVTGGAGSVVNSGTIDSDIGIQFSGTYNDTLTDSGTIVGSGGGAVVFGSGNDLLRFQPSPGAFIQGTVDGGGGTNTLEFASAASIGTLTGVGAYFTNFGQGTVDAGAQWSIDGDVMLGAGNDLALVGTLSVAGTLENAGSISPVSYAGLQIAAGGYLLNDASGTIVNNIEHSFFNPAVSAPSGSDLTIVNFGAIEDPAGNASIYLTDGGTVVNGSATDTSALIDGLQGIYAYLGRATVTNFGSIIGFSDQGIGMALVRGGVVTNGAAGSTSALVSGSGYGVFMPVGTGTVTNFGTITSARYGIDMAGGGTVVDAGTIAGGVDAIHFGGADNLVILEHGFTVTGGIVASGTGNVVELQGSAGAAVTANYNNLLMTGISTIAFALTATNYATLQITSDATLPGTITNFTGAHDTIDLTTLAFVSGSSTATFNSASDRLTVSNGTNSVTLQLGGGTYSGIGFTAVSDGTTGTDITVGPASLTYDWTGGSADWRAATNWSSGVIPGPTASATIADAGSNTVTISAAESIQVANLTLANADTLLVEGTFVPTGSIGVTGALLSIASGGTLTNTGSLVVDPPLAVTGIFINNSIVSASGSNDAVYVANGGVVTNTAGGTITGGTVAITAAGTATIDNFGIIQATSIFSAVAMASGTVINGGASNTAAAILGSGYGVQATGVATVVNYGTITANHMEGVNLRAGGSLDNLGVIDANEYGLLLYGPGTATNSGTIFSFGGGIITSYATDVVVNSGNITGGAGGGIILQSGGTVIDSGTISAGYFSVLFRGTASDLLVLENGYKLTGPVGGSASANSNVVELLGTSAANAVTVNYNGVGLTRIGTIAFAPTSTNYATLQITNDATLPGTITNFIGVHDTIDLTTLAFVSGSSTVTLSTVSNQLTVSNGTNSVTLQLGAGTYSGIGFGVASDGVTGTDITVGPASLTYDWTGGSADWRTATNWSSGVIPGPTASATIADAGSNTVTISAAESIQVANLTLANADTLLVEGTFAPTGSIGVTGALLSIASGGTASNFATLTLAAAASTLVDSGTLINGGTITGVALDVPQLELASGGYLLNQATGVILQNAGFGVYGQASGTSTVTNLGTIAGYGGIGIGVYLKGGGSVTNTSAGALLKGSIDGISVVDAAGTVVNSASIVGLGGLGNGVILLSGGTVTNAAGGVISGGDGVRMGGSGTVLNQGSITGGTIDGGVVLMSSGSVSNAAMGVISGAAYGVGALGAATVTNAGMIGATGTAGIGVTLVTGGTVIDSGTVSGAATAVAFGGTGSNLLILEHGYALTGGVVGSASASDTVELLGTSAANAVTVTYNTLGLSNVGTIAFAPGATNYATLKITNNATLPGTIAGFIGVHDTFDLTALSDAGNDATTSFNTLTNVLTVTGDDGSVMLQLDNEDYADVTWLAHNDGSGGTEITPASGAPVSFTGTLANIGVPNEATSTPFSALTVTDPTVGATDTVTITLSNPAFGTLSNLDGGDYEAATGVYTVSGTPGAVTTAINQLVLTPASPASNVYVTSTTLTVETQGPLGGPSTTSAIAASVQQILGLATVPSGQIAISVSADGTGFATAVNGDTNEAVVTSPANSDTYSVPSGYQALYVGGSANVHLFDNTVGDAVLVGNSGNDTIVAGAVNDSLVGGSGNNTLFGGTGQIAIVAGNSDNLIGAPSGSTYAISVGGGSDTVYGDGSGTVTGGSGTDLLDVAGAGTSTSNLLISNGTADTVVGGAGTTSIQAHGSQALVFGGTGDLAVVTSGSNDTISASTATTATATLGGTQTLLFGASGNTVLDDQGSQDTVAGGAGAMTVTASAASSQLQVFGGTAPLTFVGGAGMATVAGGSSDQATGGSGGLVFAAAAGSSDTVAAGSGGATLYGGANAAIALVGSAGISDVIAATGNETLSGAASGANNTFWAGSGNDVIAGGSANDALVVGSGNATLSGGAGANAFDLINGQAGGAITITDFSAQDQVGLFGYGSAAASTALQTATSSAGNTTLTLSDNTTITFLGIGSASALTGHVFST
jgi:hypothetical protein